jgi:hypothetical protein
MEQALLAIILLLMRIYQVLTNALRLKEMWKYVRYERIH